MKKVELFKACLTLMEYCLSYNAKGADFDIDTPYGEVHFTYDFTIKPKDQEDD